jgi:hypothetical protein
MTVPVTLVDVAILERVLWELCRLSVEHLQN